MMDVTTAFLVVGFVVSSGAALLLISIFSIKEKSYEEAIAEQKQQSNVLFGNINRSKLKEKKQKKIGKKVLFATCFHCLLGNVELNCLR